MSTGIQKTVAEAVKEVLDKVESGAYGTGDDFDASTFMDDLLDIETVAV